MINMIWVVSIIYLVISGIYYTFKLKFIQFRFIKIIKSIFSKNNSKISYFQVLMMNLAGKIGVGSISGVALSIYIGGAGTIFWMWFISLISITNTFAETYLGCSYQQKDRQDMIGGPSFYIKKGLKNNQLSMIYSILLIISFTGGFIFIQSNTITKVILDIVVIKPYIIGVFISVITFLILKGGLRKILKVNTVIVPFMLILYLSFVFYIVIINIGEIPNLIRLIINDAFTYKSFITGFLATMFMGIKRGIFSNESGIGTGAISSSIANVDPEKMGYVAMLGVYFTTFIVCTFTGFVILLAKYNITFNDINGIEIALLVFEQHLGIIGKIVLIISIILFAFSTIITGYYYSEACLKSIIKVDNKKLFLLKIINIACIFLGSITMATTLWNIVDILVAILLIINSYSILKLKNKVLTNKNMVK